MTASTSRAEQTAVWILTALIIVMLVGWLASWRGVLVDPGLTSDDVFQHLYFYHRDIDPRRLTGDPAVDYMPAFTPPLFREIYQIMAPQLGLHGASKTIQALQFLMLTLPAILLWRSPKAGPIVALVYLILVLRMPGLFGPSRGGLARGFGHPAVLLWMAGALIASQRVRWAGVILGGLFYPSAMVLTLTAEGVLTLGRAWDLRRPEARWAWARLGLLLTLCVLLVQAYTALKIDAGSPPWLSEAAANPAFGPDGRTRQLPLPALSPMLLLSHIGAAMAVDPNASLAGLAFRGPRGQAAVATLAGLCLMALAAVFSRRSLRGPLALFLAAVAVYLLARHLAFKLYIPDRYLKYSAPALVIGLVLATLGRPWRRGLGSLDPASARAMIAVAGVGLMLIVLGPNFRAMRPGVDRSRYGPWLEAIAQLPVDATLAGHPEDLDPVPFYTGRGVVANFETMLPWMTNRWDRILDRGQDTVDTFYATDPAAVVTYGDRYGVTHWLIRRERIGPQRARTDRIALFQPLNDRVRAQLDRQGDRLPALATPPAEAIVYDDGDYWILDAEVLRSAWRSPDPAGAEVPRSP